MGQVPRSGIRLLPGIRCHCQKRLLHHNREVLLPELQNGLRIGVSHHPGEYHARPFPRGFEYVSGFPERYPAQHKKGGYQFAYPNGGDESIVSVKVAA